MKQIMSKSRLAIILSGLEGFYKPKVRQEQYLTDSEIGASIVWNAFLLGDIEKMSIADLGCGTGILGIGALLLGAKNVLFVDSDEKALKIAENNMSKIRSIFEHDRKSQISDILKVKSEGYVLGSTEFICQDIGKLEIKADVVLQNPPFGTKVRHNDIFFLKSAMKISFTIYSFHKSETKEFLQRFSAKNNAKITHIWDFRFPLKATFSFHRRQIHRINVSCFRFKKIFK